jgi:hypothetical protein
VWPESDDSDERDLAYQVRLNLNDSAAAELARRKPDDPALVRLADILAKHRAQMKCQFDAFGEGVNRKSREEGKVYEILHALCGGSRGLCQGDR